MPRVRWDRLGRLAMLGVMAAIVYLYMSAGIRLFSAWGESKHDSVQVRALERQNKSLQHQHELLASPGTVQVQARRLGMIHSGEQAYSVSGLPAN
jgi:cell division protein FtsB